MNPHRRRFLATLTALAATPLLGAGPSRAGTSSDNDSALESWLPSWQKRILSESAHNDDFRKETGEEIGWLISPFLDGFYYGYHATGDPRWIDRMIACADAWLTRGVREPDGFTGWPKQGAASTGAVADAFGDSLLGEAMGFRPLTAMAGEIKADKTLQPKYGDTFARYLEQSENTFRKWDARASWREVGEGGVWVAAEFGIDPKTHGWTDNYARRQTEGFTLPANKQNFVAQWLLALHDATGKDVYRERARRWFVTMKSRMRLRDGKYYVWNYWDPAGPWDYKPDHSTRHWVGVHPNGGYYEVDVRAIVAAFEHKLIFDRADIDRLIATNRDEMWDGTLKPARFRSIGDVAPDPRWKDAPGVLWPALVPYDATLRRIFEANHKPDSWLGLVETPRYLALRKTAATQ